MTDTAPTTPPRRHDLDALRAVAMVSGIVLHASLSFCLFPWPVQDTQQNEAFGLIFPFLHGFRMPLFFLLSGFFTAMLWRRRGLRSLLGHRFRRIFLPLLLGIVTIIPATTWMSRIAIESGLEQASAPESTNDVGADIWAAVREGDMDAVTRHLDNGADLNEQDPASGQTPLSTAAAYGHTEVVDLLLRKGAGVDSHTQDGSTALHSAAAFGHTEIVDLLLRNGADVNARPKNDSTALHSAAFFGHAETAEHLLRNGADTNAKEENGLTPRELLSIDWETTQFIASLFKIEVDREKVEAGRNAIAELLQVTGADESKSGVTFAALMRSPLFAKPVFGHLWFLWFLCWLVAGFAVYAAVADSFHWQGISSGLVLSPARYLWLIPLTLIPQWFMSMTMFGSDTSMGLIPMPHVLLYYAIFFGFGALYYDADDKTNRVGRRYWITLHIAVFLVFPLGIVITYGGSEIGDWMGPAIQRPITGVLQVTYTWLMTFGCMGLFRRLLSRESKTMRYLSDSSYWLYLAHLPLILGAQMLVRNSQLPAMAKFILICVIVSGFLLLTYQFFVRYTPLGTLLNGRRKRPVSE